MKRNKFGLDFKLILLLVTGVAIMIYGIFTILSSPYLESENLTLYEEILKPIPIIIKLHGSIEEHQISSFDYINVNFRAMDSLAAGFPIDYIVEVNTKDTSNIEEVYFIYRNPTDSISWVNSTNFNQFLKVEKSLGNVIEIPKISPTKFYLSDTREFQSAHTYAFSVIGKSSVFNSTKIKVEPLDLLDATLQIDETVKKLQIEAARAELITSQKQYSNNLVIQGFSTIIIGWIPLELFIQFYREKRKKIQDNIKSINVVISELLDVLELINTKKPAVEFEGTHTKYNGALFSIAGFDNLIFQGTYQGLSNTDRIALSNIYHQFKISNRLGDQINDMLFRDGTITESIKKMAKTLGETYDSELKTLKIDIEKILPELRKYIE